MSTNCNPGSITNAQGEIHARIAPSQPLTTSSHAPGKKVGNDAVPECHAKTLFAGTAPLSQTFTPYTTNSILGQAMNPNATKQTWTDAQSTVTGATSADVHAGLGKPVAGQMSREIRDGRNERAGLIRVPLSRERGLDVEFPREVKGQSGENWGEEILGAEERVPESAGAVAVGGGGGVYMIL